MYSACSMPSLVSSTLSGCVVGKPAFDSLSPRRISKIVDMPHRVPLLIYMFQHDFSDYNVRLTEFAANLVTFSARQVIFSCCQALHERMLFIASGNPVLKTQVVGNFLLKNWLLENAIK